jgi:hypothetical protein
MHSTRGYDNMLLPCRAAVLLQSTVVFAAVGATTNGKDVLANCQANIKSGWFRGSVLERSLKKATDTWLPGDCE